MVSESFTGKFLFTISTVVEAVAQASEPQQALDMIAAKLPESIGFDCYWVYLLDEPSGELRLAAHHGLSPEMTSLRIGESLIGQVAQSGQPLIIPDISETSYPIPAALVRVGMHSFAAAPLMSGGRMIGAIGLASRAKLRYIPQSVEALATIAHLMGIIVDKVTLYQQAKERGEQLALIDRLTRTILLSPDIEEVYEVFADELREVMDVDWATITLIEGEELRFLALSQRLSSLALSAIAAPTWAVGEVIPLKGTGTEWVAIHKRSLAENDLMVEHRFWTGEHHIRQGVRSIVYLPLLFRGEVFGALLIASRRPNAYGERELNLLEQLVAQISGPIEMARLYAREREQRMELERQEKERVEFVAAVTHELKTP